MTKQATATSTVATFSNPAEAMDAAVTQYATGERARPVVATDGKKFMVCSKATAKAKGWDIEAKLFKRERKAGEQGVQQARSDAKATKAKAKAPAAAEFWGKLEAQQGKRAAKRTERQAKLETIKTVNKAQARAK